MHGRIQVQGPLEMQYLVTTHGNLTGAAGAATLLQKQIAIIATLRGLTTSQSLVPVTLSTVGFASFLTVVVLFRSVATF
jgi:hypothetical protein